MVAWKEGCGGFVRGLSGRNGNSQDSIISDAILGFYRDLTIEGEGEHGFFALVKSIVGEGFRGV